MFTPALIYQKRSQYKRKETLQSIKYFMNHYSHVLTHSRLLPKKNYLDIYVVCILNNNDFCNQNFESLTKHLPAWTIYSQHNNYHHRRPVYYVFKKTWVWIFCQAKGKVGNVTGHNCLGRK
jgi:hypothetical protein